MSPHATSDTLARPQKSPAPGQPQVLGVSASGAAHGTSPPKWSAVGGAALGAVPALLRESPSASASELAALAARLREVKRELVAMTDERDAALARLAAAARAGRDKEGELTGMALEAIRSARERVDDADRHHRRQLVAVLEGSNAAKTAAQRVALDTPRALAATLLGGGAQSPALRATLPLGNDVVALHATYAAAIDRCTTAREAEVAAVRQTAAQAAGACGGRACGGRACSGRARRAPKASISEEGKFIDTDSILLAYRK